LLIENIPVVELWPYLKGQIVQHSLKKESKSDPDKSLTVLRYDAVERLMNFRGVPQEERWDIFRKLYVMCDEVYDNPKPPTEEDKKNATKKHMMGFLQKLNAAPKAKKK